MGRRTQTVLNREHPHNMMKEAGDKAKRAARDLSRDDLDALMANSEAFAGLPILAVKYSRGQKLKLIKRAAELNFIAEWEAAQAAVEEDRGGEADD